MKITELSPLVKRLTAGNASVFTGPGTNTYIVGKENFTVIDPGPAIEEHIKDIVKVCGEDISQILVTHTHPDHSPGAKLLHQRTAAPVMGMYAKYPKHQDRTFKPNKELSEGDEIKEVDHTLIAIHTPGHASNHICFFLEEEKMLFTGDHIMEGSTVVISPPDGNMTEYIDSLKLLENYDIDYFAPGHGNFMEEPSKTIQSIIRHRLSRESKVIRCIVDKNNSKIEKIILDSEILPDDGRMISTIEIIIFKN